MLRFFKLALWSIAGALCLSQASPALASPPVEEGKQAERAFSQFLRVQRDEQQRPVALETSIVRYVPASGEGDFVVDLIGAVHIADAGYFRQLNEHFEQYDALLYELVAPAGAEVPRAGRQPVAHPLAMLQQMMKSALALESQLEHIDYTRKNFVHADMSPEQMAEAMRQRGESGLSLFLRVAGELLEQQNVQQARQANQEDKQAEAEPLNPLALLLDPQASVKLKRQLAEQFALLEGPGGGLGPTLNALLVEDRNQAALRVLARERDSGKRRIGIFYGAAHMPDFEQRLMAEFGLQRDNVQWLTAWDLKKEKSTKPTGLEGFLKLLQPPQ